VESYICSLYTDITGDEIDVTQNMSYEQIPKFKKKKINNKIYNILYLLIKFKLNISSEQNIINHHNWMNNTSMSIYRNTNYTIKLVIHYKHNPSSGFCWRIMDLNVYSSIEFLLKSFVNSQH